MRVIYQEEQLIHRPEISIYAHNYYNLPESFDGCSVLYEEWSSGGYNEPSELSIGNFDEHHNYVAEHYIRPNIDNYGTTDSYILDTEAYVTSNYFC